MSDNLWKDSTSNSLQSTGGLLLSALHPGWSSTPGPNGQGGGLVIGVDLGLMHEPTSCSDIHLGVMKSYPFVALSRAKLYWLVPAWGCTSADIPVETQFLLLDLSGWYAVFLPLIDSNTFTGSLRPSCENDSNGKDTIVLRMESGDDSACSRCFEHALYVQVGRDPYALIDEAVVVAANLSGSGRSRIEKAVPGLIDWFGWCTWDAMYADVCPKGITEGLQAFSNGGTPVKILIIDDGWMNTGLDAGIIGYNKREASRGHEKPGVGFIGDSLRVARTRHLSEALHMEAQQSEPLKTLEEELEGEEERERKTKISSQSMLSRWWSMVAEAVTTAQHLIQIHATKLLQRVLSDTSSDSTSLAFFASLARGPFRNFLIEFYAQASHHSRRLLSIKANGKFAAIDSGPEAGVESVTENFGDVINEMKSTYGVRHVLCWHALACGYWGGLMPEVESTKAFQPSLKFPKLSQGLLEVDPSMQWVHPSIVGVGLPTHPDLFFNALHLYLASNGVDGVKCDVESTITMFGEHEGGGAAIASRYHKAFEESSQKHFGVENNVLNSMCCAIESLYNMSHTNLLRVGEDYYPHLPASHTAHLANAAFTTLMLSAIGYCDWDMFFSDHHSARLHAAARAVCGGPIYCSDKVAHHNFDLLRRLVLPDGSILRCKLPARPTLDVLFKDVSRDRQTVLKVWSMNAITGVVGVFNVQGATWVVKKRVYYAHDSKPHRLQTSVSPGDIPQLHKAEKYVVYSDAQRKMAVVKGREGCISLSLAGGGGHDIITVSPVAVIGDLEVSPVGLANMFNAGGAVQSFEMAPEGRSIVVTLLVHGQGPFLLYSNRQPLRVSVDGSLTSDYCYQTEIHAVYVKLPMADELHNRILILVF